METRFEQGTDGQLRRLTVSFDEEALRLTSTPFGTMIEMEDAPPAGEPGGPALPGAILRVAIPPFTEIESVEGEAIETRTVTRRPIFPTPMQLARPGVPARRDGDDDSDEAGRGPESTGAGEQGGAETGQDPNVIDQQPLRPSSVRLREESLTEAIAPPRFTPPDVGRYSAEQEDPRPYARLIATERVGLTSIAVIQVNPVRLDREGYLVLATRIQITIDTRAVKTGPDEGNGAAGVAARMRPINSRVQAARLVELGRMVVINPDDVWDFSPVFPDLVTNVDYLIITDNQRWDADTISPTGPVTGDVVAEFERLAEWKERRGLRTRVVTVSEIVQGAYGDFVTGARDLQEVIRAFVKHAYSRWGVAWLLIGGDLDLIPTRRAPGASQGHIDTDTTDPPDKNRAFWTGSFLKMNVQSPGTWFPATNSPDLILVRPDTGLLIPYDAAGTSGPTQRGWYFTTDSTGATRTTTAGQWIRVNGPASQVNAKLQWIYHWNHIPTDLYYASLVGSTYGIPGTRDWDLTNNGLYGQHTDSVDLDGVDYQADVSVGRAPVSAVTQAKAFVDKVIAYEQFRRADGTALSESWARKMLIVSANWGGRKGIPPTSADPPGDNRYHHAAVATHTLIKLKDPFDGLDWRLLAEVSATDVRIMPYDRDAATVGRGWHYAVSATDLSPSEISINLFWISIDIPIPTNWVVVYGPTAELTPGRFIFDHIGADGSLRDQEELRTVVQSQLPQINDIERLYEDDVDLTPAQVAAGPVQHLSADRLRDAFNAGKHFVSLSGHGNSNGCCGLSTAMADALTNGNHAFIAYADSCLTNQFDAEDAVSEHLVYNAMGGAVAYVGNSRFSWIGVGDNFQRRFFQRLATTRHLGLLNDTRCGMVNESTGFYRLYNKWQILSLNLMGDPEMPVWLGPPRTMKVKYAAELDSRVPFEVTVTRRFLFIDVPLPGVVVHIEQGALAHTATTDGAGRAVFDISAAHLGELEITATRSGYRPFIGTAEVVGPAWVAGQVRLVSQRHNGANATYIRLHLSPALNGDTVRGWFARPSVGDYTPILDAATDAYISDEAIAFFVASIKEGGTIERYRFGSTALIALPPRIVTRFDEHVPIEQIQPASIEVGSEPAETAAAASTTDEPRAADADLAEAETVSPAELAGTPRGPRVTVRSTAAVGQLAERLRSRRRLADDPNLEPLATRPLVGPEARVSRGAAIEAEEEAASIPDNMPGENGG
jgi:hypothetical protein